MIVKTPATRLSGHIVQGHVDATGVVEALDELGGGNWWLKVRVPAELDPYLVYKGSVAIDGISLTIAALEGDVLSVTIIPHTYKNTTLGTYQPGNRVNIECDILAKHVEKLIRTAHEQLEAQIKAARALGTPEGRRQAQDLNKTPIPRSRAIRAVRFISACRSFGAIPAAGSSQTRTTAAA